MTVPVFNTSLSIFYPNGQTEASQMYIWTGGQPVLWDGSVTFSGSLPSTVAGNLTNNNAAPSNNNLGVLNAICSTTAMNYTTGNQVMPRCDTTGALVVSATLSTTGLATSANQTNGAQITQIADTTGAIVAQTSNALNVSIKSSSLSNQSVNVAQVGGNNVATGNGSVNTSTQRVTLAVSTGYQHSAVSTTVLSVTTSPAVLTGYYIYNPNSSVAYVQVFNATTGAVTLGTTAPIQSFGIPATAAANIAAKRVNFSSAISIAATTTMTGSTAPSSGLDVNIDYEN